MRSPGYPGLYSIPPSLRSAALVLLGLGSAAFLQADTILDLTIDDPQGILKAKPEGISRVSGEFASSRASIASGTGGRILPQLNDGPSEEKEGKPAEVKLQMAAEPAMGTSGFFRASLEANSVARNAGIGIIPDGVESSLSALVTYENGYAIINGGFDFFFRATVDGGSQPKVGIWAKCGELGFNVTTDPTGNRLLLKVFTKGRSIDSDGDKKGDKTGIFGKSPSETIIESGTIYHAAVVFHTSPEGLVTMDLCLQPGTGPMNPANCVVASINNFAVLAEGQRSEADKIAISVGQNQFPQTFDIAAFRIFKPVPDILPGIDGKK